MTYSLMRTSTGFEASVLRRKLLNLALPELPASQNPNIDLPWDLARPPEFAPRGVEGPPAKLLLGMGRLMGF